MVKLLFSFILSCTLSIVLATNCAYEDYPHKDDLLSIVNELRETITIRSEYGLEGLRNEIEVFETNIRSRAVGGFGEKILHVTKAASANIENMIRAELQGYLAQYEIEASTGQTMVLDAGESLKITFSEATSKAGADCETNALQLFYDIIKSCIKESEEVVRDRIDLVISAINDISEEFKIIFENILNDVKELTHEQLLDALIGHKYAFERVQGRSRMNMYLAISNVKSSLEVANLGFRECSNRIVDYAAATRGSKKNEYITKYSYLPL